MVKNKTEKVPFFLDLEKVLVIMKTRLGEFDTALNRQSQISRGNAPFKLRNKNECIEELVELNEEFNERGDRESVKNPLVPGPRTSLRRMAFVRSDFSGSEVHRRRGRRITVDDAAYEDSDDEVSL